ncbi:MAG: hypothetical protein ACUVYA_20940, partial [Planctomycetota bacterium]
MSLGSNLWAWMLLAFGCPSPPGRLGSPFPPARLGRLFAPGALGALFVPAALGADGLEVGDGREFLRIEDALAKAQPGDTIRVHPLSGGRAYERPALLVRKPRIALVAVRRPGGKRVRLDGTGFEYSGAGSTPRAIVQFDPGADGSSLEGFELSGARNGSANGAGVRINHANDIAIRDCEIHHCDMGIMSNGEVSKGSARNQAIEACEIHENGSELHAGYNHNLYLGGTSVLLRGSNVWGATTGHNFKSRAHLNWIEASYVHDSANREFDLVDQEGNTDVPESHSVIAGCVIAKAREIRGNRAVIHFGQDGGKDHRGTLYLVHSTIITPYAAPVVEVSAPGASLLIQGTVVWDGGAAQPGQVLAAVRGGATLERISGRANWISRNFSIPPALSGAGSGRAGRGAGGPAPARRAPGD